MANNYGTCQEAASIANISVSEIGVPANQFVTKSQLVATGKFASSPLSGYSTNEFVKLSDMVIGTVATTGVTLSRSTLSLNEGDSDTLIPTILPSNASNKNVTWVSSQPSRVSVTSNGLVTAHSAGSAVITVTTSSGGFKATCTVTAVHIAVPVTMRVILATDVRNRGTVQINSSAPVSTEHSMTVSEGDSITFKCNMANSKDVFDGWYNGSTKVSSTATYPFIAGISDVTLTAKFWYMEVSFEINTFKADGTLTSMTAPTVITTNTNWSIT